MKSVLFVCLGNICRSPAAEGIFQYLINKSDLANEIYVESAGISSHHEGQLPDSRMQHYASLRGYKLTSRSRVFDPNNDFDRFDIIVTMDETNEAAVRSMARNSEDIKKITPAIRYLTKHQVARVPDPYYGGDKGFELF